MHENRRIEKAAMIMLAAGVILCGVVACQVGGSQTISTHPRPSTEPDANMLVQQYGGRAPRPCPAIRHKPSDAEAAVLAQCTMEGSFGSTERLLTNVQIHITGSHKFSTDNAGAYNPADNNRKDIDNRAEVLTIVGYAKQYACGVQSFAPGKSCTITDMPNGAGACWKTSYGEYRCNFVSVGGNGYQLGPPPTNY
jgi:hypothetical protein